MSFEKYGQTNNALIEGLRIEESELMRQVNTLMCQGVKEASEQQELSRLENRLHQVRARITEADLAR